MKKLNLAFIWHFHQPNYQEDVNTDFLLPWARLHASKDYLDMLKKIDNCKNLKLNFNFSPVLLATLQKYLQGAMDLHSRVLLKDENELTKEDKIFILNNYFDLNYKNMVLKRPYYTELYNRRANITELNTEVFSLSEYSDIMANYTLCWIDEVFCKDYPELDTLLQKEKNYNLNDRKRIFEIQIDIIRRILVEYKKYQNEKKIEVLTSPFYHPILPLLIDFKNKDIKNFENLPNDFSWQSDAKEQIELAVKKYEEIFETKPKGMWLSEQCICSKTAEMLSKSEFKWTVCDEGILSKSLKKEFIRDFEGVLEDPYNLNLAYRTKNKNSLNILFADSFFANLLNFGYGNYDSKIAANDMYEKIKIIQSKLQNSPNDSHILTIALDGENCWETYENDGNNFLDSLYSLIDSDETLQTVLVNEFLEQAQCEMLENLKSGSWINRNFDLWIGEPIKNIAWLYLSTVRKDLENWKAENKNHPNFEEKYNKAKEEIFISQSSDWYWWYGEPNESKSDGIFDYLFRSHLKNVYKILGMEIPEYLTISLANSLTRPLRKPTEKITPSLVADINDEKNEWINAGNLFIPDGPTSNISRLVKNIYFGKDDENVYFRFELNKNSVKMTNQNIRNQIAIYFVNPLSADFSPIRLVNKNENIYPILKNQFSQEVRFIFDDNKISRLFFNKATAWGLWTQLISKNAKIVYKDVIELKIPLCDLGCETQKISFCIIDSTNDLINEIYPQDVLVDI